MNKAKKREVEKLVDDLLDKVKKLNYARYTPANICVISSGNIFYILKEGKVISITPELGEFLTGYSI